MRKWTFGLAALGLSLFIAGTTLAQNQPGGNGQAGGSGAAGQNGGGGRGGRGGNFDPTQMRANMMDRIKTELGATDGNGPPFNPGCHESWMPSVTPVPVAEVRSAAVSVAGVVRVARVVVGPQARLQAHSRFQQ